MIRSILQYYLVRGKKTISVNFKQENVSETRRNSASF